MKIPLKEIFVHPRYEMPGVFEAGEPVEVKATRSSSDLTDSIKENAPYNAMAYKVVDTVFVSGNDKIMRVQYYK